MERLPPIPIPLSRRWREFRHTFLPLVVFAVVVTVVVRIWLQDVMPPTLIGEVEAIRANVSSTQAGRLARLDVGQFSQVRAGDPVAQVITTDPAVLQATLAVIQAEVELLRAGTDPVLNKERNQLDFERLRLDLLTERVQLATSKIHLQYAEAELERVNKLYRGEGFTNIASQAEYDLALRNQQALQAEIAERSRLVGQTESGLARFRLASADSVERDPDTLRAAIALQEQKVKLAEAQLRPVTLNSPIEGTVSMIYRRSGENVGAGEPILTIVAGSDRIIGYILPPVQVEPTVGMAVEVRSRGPRRESARATITHVGEHMELIMPTLLSQVGNRASGLDSLGLDRANRALAVGLPLAVSRPAGLRLRHGEFVDLRLLPQE
ncbi:MAG: HlyD family efflux transporter periplasmic adaptor subunit [Verrucomicrobia bacterium]|nr:HlyD family efflux transporter periplasmic adaptor subunit [Verrucomicrobiota bacterium]